MSFEDRKVSKERIKPSLEDVYGKGSSRRMEGYGNGNLSPGRGNLSIPDKSYRSSIGASKIGLASSRLSSLGQLPTNVSLPAAWFHPTYSVFSKIGMEAMMQSFEQKRATAQKSSGTSNQKRPQLGAISPKKSKSNLDTNGSEDENDDIVTVSPKTVSPTLQERVSNGNIKISSSTTSNTNNNNSNNNNNNGNSNSNNNSNTNNNNIKSNSKCGMFGMFLKPNDMSEEDWIIHILEFEASGEWVEARESLSGRILWFNSKSFRIVFDNPPPGVSPVSATVVAKTV
ncbi:hypothetical protein RFI_15325 [Reticulomyxa filosa]|uniref:Uncharacterized protein n=1 Tax=Reticulomyxa filosa TaxID=46433 RepID=X6N823_RETFI|nr:hypothetical protein RFI_15325 [Reticulomyxa filosa]|eukprot:ETO21879.1 hypothetical protein RFI_15325 [Reticulomyxa filosa]